MELLLLLALATPVADDFAFCAGSTPNEAKCSICVLNAYESCMQSAQNYGEQLLCLEALESGNEACEAAFPDAP